MELPYMPTMNISLPESLRQFIEQQVAGRGYSSASEYFRELVRDDQKRLAKEELETMLLASMRAPGEAMTRASWDGLRKTARNRQRTRAAS
jgi:antitoxin ParD1/3/4